MKRIFFLFCTLIALTTSARAGDKSLDTLFHDSIRNIEYQLEGLSYNIINGADVTERITSCYYFIQKLKKALSVPSSFNYEFPLLANVKTVSILKPDNEAFRLFTWNLLLDSGKYMYFGALQMNNPDSLVLFGLYDSAEKVKDPLYETVDNRHWIGALYYQIYGYKYKRQNYYILFGWDGEDENSNKKVIDVLWFNEDGQPRFGAPVFAIGDEIQLRMIFEFADQAVMLCRYDEREDVIVYARTVPTSPYLTGRYEYYLPDGSYNYLKYQKGFWVNYETLFFKRRKNSYDLRNR